MPAGAHAKVSRSAASGTSSQISSRDGRQPVKTCTVIPKTFPSSAISLPKRIELASWLKYSSTASFGVAERAIIRRWLMMGVIPTPPATNRARAGGVGMARPPLEIGGLSSVR